VPLTRSHRPVNTNTHTLLHTHSRAALIERLQVESKLQTGLWRLLLFITLFILLVIVTRSGTPSIQRRAVGTLLENSLFLSQFLALKRLDDVRDFLPLFSSAIKRFSASSSSRFQDADAYQLLGVKTFIHIYVCLYTLSIYTYMYIYICIDDICTNVRMYIHAYIFTHMLHTHQHAIHKRKVTHEYVQEVKPTSVHQCH